MAEVNERGEIVRPGRAARDAPAQAETPRVHGTPRGGRSFRGFLAITLLGVGLAYILASVENGVDSVGSSTRAAQSNRGTTTTPYSNPPQGSSATQPAHGTRWTRQTEGEAESSISYELVMRAQQALSRLGYVPGPVDGIVGSRTQRAVAKFQRDSGLAVDEQVSERLVRLLESEVWAKPSPASEKPSQVSEKDEIAHRCHLASMVNYDTLRGEENFSSISFEMLQGLVDRMSGQGWLLVEFNPAVYDNLLYVSPKFIRAAGRTWQGWINLTKNRLLNQCDDYSGQGFKAISVQTYQLDGSTMYAATWTR